MHGVLTSPEKAEAEDESPDASLSSRVRSGALWSGASALMFRFVNIAVTAVVVRIVSPHDFGVFAIAITVYTVVSSMSELGMLSIVTRGDTDLDDLGPTVNTIALASNVVIAAAMFTFAKPLATVLGSSQAADPLRVLALVVLLFGVFAVPGAVMAREFRQDQIFFANAIAFVPSNALLIFLAHRGDGAMAFAWSRLLGQLIVGILTVLWASKRIGFGFQRRHLGFVLGVGLPMAGANLVGCGLLNADYLFVGRQLGAIELGIYMLAFNVASWSTSLLGAMINGVAMPAFSRVKSDITQLRRTLSRAHYAVGLVAWPICALTWASAYPLVETLYGHKWTSAAPVLMILAPYGLVFIHSLLFSNLLVGGAGHARVLFLTQLLWIAALIPSMAIGIKVDGIVGVAVAHLVVICLVVMPTYVVAVRRMIGVEVFGIAKVLRPVAVAALMAGLADTGLSLLVDAPLAKLLLGLAGGGVVYLVLSAPALKNMIPAGRGDGAIGRVMALIGTAAELADRPRLALGGRRRDYGGRHFAQTVTR